MRDKRFLWVLLGTAGLGLLLASVGEAARSSEFPSDDGRPISVEGDSFAIGIAQALRQKYPGRNIDSARAKVGLPALRMPSLKDRPVFHILSAGTNDLAGDAGAADVASRIVGVLGPYADGSATSGYAALVLPHSGMGGRLGERARLLREELKKRLPPSKRLALVEIGAEPAAADRIHFDPAGYAQIATDAMQALSWLLRKDTSP